jgi:FdrA protein
VLVSTPGRYAAGVAEEALRLGKHVFLYSDNVSVEDEVRLKQQAASQGLLVMGPDCGTAIVRRRGVRLRQPGAPGGRWGWWARPAPASSSSPRASTNWAAGVSHALGTGGRDLSAAVGAITARQGLALLAQDASTRVIVLVSKPPDAAVAEELVAAARAAGKPVVIDFIGYRAAEGQIDNVYFAATMDAAAALAVELAGFDEPVADTALPSFAPGPALSARGLFRRHPGL